MMRVILLGALLAPGVLSAQRATAVHRDIAVAGEFHPVAIRLVLQIPASAIRAKHIAALSVSPTGEVIVADGNERLLAFGTSGELLRTLGNGGEAYGEFGSAPPLGWLSDTLAALDQKSGRISLFSVQTGALLAVLSWPHTLPQPGLFTGPMGLLDSGERLYAVMERRTGPMQMNSLGPNASRAPLPVNTIVPVTAAGVGLAMLQPSDSAEHGSGMECLDKNGNVQILNAFFPDHGSIRAVTPSGRLITASRDSFVLTVRQTDSPIPDATIRGPQMRWPVTQAIWDSVAAEYREVDHANSIVRCDPPATRPLFLPAIRAIAADDAGRLWIEVSDRTGTAIDVLLQDGTPLATFHMPPHDASVAWRVWNNRLYLAVTESDGQQGVQVFRINP